MKTKLLQKKINTLGKKKILKHHSVKQAGMLPYFADTKTNSKKWVYWKLWQSFLENTNDRILYLH